MMMHGKWMSWLAGLLWVLSVVALALAWVAVTRRGLVFGLEPLAWYWNSLVFGVLSLGVGKCACGVCMPEKSGM